MQKRGRNETLARASRILVFVVAAAILVLSLLPRMPESFDRMRYSDKLAHFFAYLCWGALVFLALQEGLIWRRVLVGMLICLLFGGLIEYLQRFTGRSTDLLDLLADGLGAGAGAAVGYRFLRRPRAPGRPPMG